jgi:protease-4
VFTNSRIKIAEPVEANITARLAPNADDGPVIPMPVSGHPDRCSPRIALLDVDGLLVNSNLSGPLVTGENPVAVYHEKLKAIEKDGRVAAVVVRINSPGGGVAASQIMRHELVSFRQRTGVPVVACLMDVGAGGAYYLATACDVIYAQPGTVTGGIGVIFNAYSLQDTMAQWNILGQAVRAGDNIDLGSPVRGLNEESRAILQQMANQYHQQFRDDVLEARPIVRPVDPAIFDGRVFTSMQALDKGLVDRVGSLEDAIEAARILSGRASAMVVMYERKSRPAYSIYSTTHQTPPQATISLPSVPGLNRSHLPMFLYMWQPEPTVQRLGGI